MALHHISYVNYFKMTKSIRRCLHGLSGTINMFADGDHALWEVIIWDDQSVDIL